MATFQEQAAEVDVICKRMKVTRNGSPNEKDLMVAVEQLFKTRGWNFSAYITWANDNYNARMAKERADKGFKPEGDTAEINEEMARILEQLGPKPKSTKR